jgi:hypothetical protein
MPTRFWLSCCSTAVFSTVPTASPLSSSTTVAPPPPLLRPRLTRPRNRILLRACSVREGAADGGHVAQCVDAGEIAMGCDAASQRGRAGSGNNNNNTVISPRARETIIRHIQSRLLTLWQL